MRRVDVGFFVFMAVVFLAPELPVAGTTIPPGFVGLFLWILLGALNLPVAQVTREPWFTAAAMFAVWAVMVSIQSPLASLYAYQQLVYFVPGGLLIRAYAVARPAWFGRLLTVVGSLYAAAIVISLWTGPFYPWQMGFFVRGDVLRGGGTSSSVNQAGGVAAVFAILMLGRGQRLAGLLCIAATFATFSRSAAVAFAAGAASLAVHHFVQGQEKRAFRLGGLLVVALVGMLLLSALQDSGFTTTRAAVDLESRLDRWRRGVELWQRGDDWQLLVGDGFQSETVITSHNYYIEVLADLGLIGLMLFGILAASSLWAARRSPASAALIVLLTHNLTERFLHHPAVIVTFLLCLAAIQALRPAAGPRPAPSTQRRGPDPMAGALADPARAHPARQQRP